MRTWKPYFIWRGKCSLDMGIEVLKLPPIIRPKLRVEQVAVPGRHGVLYVSDNTYEPVVRSVEIGILGGDISSVFSWLNGYGDVIFSNEPDKRYDGCIINKISLEQVIRQIRKGLIQFDCQPFKRELTEEPITLLEPETVRNKGTVASQPVITVYGRGRINVYINNRAFELNEITDYIVIDSRIQNAYREANELMNRHMTGELPYFDVGLNEVRWSGSVDKMVIQPGWRWL